jgi:hypothetical protein
MPPEQGRKANEYREPDQYGTSRFDTAAVRCTVMGSARTPAAAGEAAEITSPLAAGPAFPPAGGAIPPPVDLHREIIAAGSQMA